MGDFLMFDDKGPLLYIDSVTTDVSANNQTIFDSRTKKTSNNFTDIKKLTNIIAMYQKDKPVFCKLYTKIEDIYCFPMSLNNDVLTVKKEDGKLMEFKISEIKDLEIINFY